MKKIIITFLGLILVERLFSKSSNVEVTSNITAFLKTIQYAEGTYQSQNPYAVTYGYSHTIRDFSNHPAITGEWTGKILPAQYCKAAGQPAGCKSTAAGAYQIIKPTWQGILNKLPYLNFDAESQDEAAIFLIKSRGAYSLIEADDFEAAIYKLNTLWASLPGSPFGQPTKNMGELKDFYLSV